jgi:hypothetical protein
VTRPALAQRLRRAGIAALLLALAACGTGGGADPGRSAMSDQGQAVMANPDLDPGSSLGGRPAPDFRLVNQFGQRMSLSQFRGKVVILAFTDAECTTICPLSYPVGLDATGRFADGYQLADQPWFVLLSASGKILWKHDGWLPLRALETAARQA